MLLRFISIYKIFTKWKYEVVHLNDMICIGKKIEREREREAAKMFIRADGINYDMMTKRKQY